jgi:hypothetical protein
MVSSDISTIYRRYKYSLDYSPDMPKRQVDVNTKQTDIIMFNSRNLGALIVDEKPHVKSWDEPQYSIQNLGIEESYGSACSTKVRRLQSRRTSRSTRTRCRRRRRSIIAIGASRTRRSRAVWGLVGANAYDINSDPFELATVGFVSY